MFPEHRRTRLCRLLLGTFAPSASPGGDASQPMKLLFFRLDRFLPPLGRQPLQIFKDDGAGSMLQRKIDNLPRYLLSNIGVDAFCLAVWSLCKSTVQHLGLFGLLSDDVGLLISTVYVRGRMNELPRQYSAVWTNNLKL